jgi:4-amino-4-deoxy-L-arabinose transferase-like glycosyltransferase
VTLAIVFAFVQRITRVIWPAVLAVLLLATSVGFYGEHGARTGDYDALLCLFTTGYTCLLFLVIHRRRPGWPLLLACAASIAGATMTKSVAGLLPGIGVAFHVLATRRLGRVLGNPRYLAVMILALLPIALFYVAREVAEPGYLGAVWYNDFAGRAGRALDGHGGPPWYYLLALFHDGLFSAGALGLLAPAGLLYARGRSKHALFYALCCVAGELLAISASATKLPQYALPAIPWICIACALAAHAGMPRLLEHGEGEPRSRTKPAVAFALIAVAVANIGVRTGIMRYSMLPDREYMPQAGYGALLSALHDRGVTEVTIVDPGFDVEGIHAYAPQLDYYALLWRSRDMAIDRTKSIPDRSFRTIASCDPGISRVLIARGGQPIGFAGCGFLSQGGGG